MNGGASPGSVLHRLERATLADLLRTLKIAPTEPRLRLLRPLAAVVQRPFLRDVVRFDRETATHGIGRAAGWLLERWDVRCRCSGDLPAPREGPLLLAANHPGTIDALLLLANLSRDDVRIIAEKAPFLEALPTVRRHLFLVPHAGAGTSALRRGRAHLRGGGALLLFPAGAIEPDPAHHRDALAHLARWSPSVELFARGTEDLRVRAALIAGVLHPAALRHPLARLFRERERRERSAVALQLPSPHLRALEAELSLRTVPEEEGGLHSGVLSAMEDMIRSRFGGVEPSRD